MIKEMVYGAFIASLSAVLSILNSLTGTFFDSFLGYVLLFPIIFYTKNYGLKKALIMSFALFFVTLLVSPLSFLLIIVFSIVIGLFLGISLKYHFKDTYVFMITQIISMSYNIILLDILAYVLHIGDTFDTTMLTFSNQIPYLGLFFKYVNSLHFLIVVTGILEAFVILTLIQIIFNKYHLPVGHYDLSSLTFKSPFMIFCPILTIVCFFFSSYVVFSYLCLISFHLTLFIFISSLFQFLIKKGYGHYRFFIFITLFIPILDVFYFIVATFFILGKIFCIISKERRDKND